MLDKHIDSLKWAKVGISSLYLVHVYEWRWCEMIYGLDDSKRGCSPSSCPWWPSVSASLLQNLLRSMKICNIYIYVYMTHIYINRQGCDEMKGMGCKDRCGWVIVYTVHVLIRDCNRFCYKIGGGGRGIVWNSKGLKHFAVFVQRPRV